MDGKITKDGELIIVRQGKKIKQECPFANSTNTVVYCGHHCPLFGEVTYKDMIVTGREKKSEDCKKYRLDICQNKDLIFENLTDERIKV